MTVDVLLPPTSYLPPIRSIPQYPHADLVKALRYLRLIYNPEVRGIRRKTAGSKQTGPPDAASADLDVLRTDAFERSHAIRWLTALVAQTYRELELESTESDDTALAQEALIQDAAALLAICAGTAAAGILTRSFRFGALTVQVTDAPLENQDYTSVGAQTWGSACLLAEMLVERPQDFKLDAAPRVLELGAGTGLVSVTAGKLLEAGGTHVAVVATDFHPSILVNLKQNVEANLMRSGTPTVSVTTHFLDWSQFPTASPSSPFDAPFDLILGADIVYEAEHARWIRDCVAQLLRRDARARFHLVIPLRPTHVLESRTVEEVFPAADAVDCGPALAILAKVVIACEAYGDVRARTAGDDVEYVHYTIGWHSLSAS